MLTVMKRSLCSNLRVLKENNEQANRLVYKFSKSLYGLKQCGRKWYLTLKGFLGVLGFPSIQDECLFIEKDKGDIEGVICFWVDYMVILRKRQHFCKNFKNKVSEKFRISSYGDLSWS